MLPTFGLRPQPLPKPRQNSGVEYPWKRGALLSHLYGYPVSREALPRACSALSSFLVSCTVLLIAVMPWTEYFWNPDEFSHGAPDFELALLTVLTGLCLVLLVLQLCKQNRQLVMSARYWLSLFFRAKPLLRMPRAHSGLISHAHAIPLPSPVLGKYSLPLQI